VTADGVAAKALPRSAPKSSTKKNDTTNAPTTMSVPVSNVVLGLTHLAATGRGTSKAFAGVITGLLIPS
jgi:hypothetical protein